MILRCTCPHPFQDRRYGASMRVHNLFRKSGNLMARCTVCKAEQTVKADPKVTTSQ